MGKDLGKVCLTKWGIHQTYHTPLTWMSASVDFQLNDPSHLFI